ncbi:MAG: flagellar biosynthesis protein FlhA [Sinobacteraceae bacterium]|nr:flagellar biosynthesis protein FlhA [Nevskiaceae bacterium]MCP5339096.1 flagellar biosynthesis protein FlhA [Nevskiaceae bacterium]MCP5360005.1 flagellar biosynthesis protein FlhA [Nevskiaceae bacterium]MCP5466935.1 flagellar biosynthesis protein FlhA [Nevskiaceae bacterium]MCP5472175.1 flagellar biosynthesis protein FlhA [Nevskiaceae bacterium]
MATAANPAMNGAAFRAMLLRGIGVPIGLLAMLAMIVVPLPPLALDILFTFNIALSLLIVIAVFTVRKPLDFAIFPSVLLIATMFRLALNVASTRVVLINGHTGPSAAGHVIESFGEFVIGGDYAVGIIVFAILTIINFVVVTKGAGRISEVSARFTLDAMPGKQMAIDADLNAGLVTQDEARVRRAEVRAEADFYGSMDGASKFVRGDATAGILILVINIIGGIAIGTMAHDLAFGDASRVYTLLTVGDGLVAQIPALLLSTAVAVIVTRMSRDQDMGSEVAAKLFGDPRMLGVAAGVLGSLGLIPGMPNVAFLAMASLCGGGAWWAWQRQQRVAAEPAAALVTPAPTAADSKELSWEDVRPVDLIALEVGYRLVPLVDKAQGGELLARIRGVRRKLSQDLGFLISAVHIRDNLELAPNAYRINLSGVPIGESVIYPDRELAINPGRVFGTLQGIETRDPAFGMDAVWIETSLREHAQALGYTVVDATTVVATHLSHVVQLHAHELLGHEEVQQLLNAVARSTPKLVEDLVPKAVPLAVIVKVLQGLLVERIPIRNLRSILETIAEQASRTQDPQLLTAQVRVALSRQIVQDIAGMAGEIPVITLEPELEQLLTHSIVSGAASPGLEPGLAERLQTRLAESCRQQESLGQPAVLLVAPALRPTLARFLRAGVPSLHVIAWNEVPDNRRVRLVATVGR